MAEQRRQGSPPPPEQSFDGSVAPALYVRGMGGSDDSTRWLAALVMLAWRASDDPDRCLELARSIRAMGDALGVPERLQHHDQRSLRVVTQGVVGEDELLDRGRLIDSDGDPAEVA